MNVTTGVFEQLEPGAVPGFAIRLYAIGCCRRVWHLLSDPDARFHDLGPGFYDTRIDADRRKRNHARQLEALGSTVTPQPAA